MKKFNLTKREKVGFIELLTALVCDTLMIFMMLQADYYTKLERLEQIEKTGMYDKNVIMNNYAYEMGGTWSTIAAIFLVFGIALMILGIIHCFKKNDNSTNN